MVEQLDVGTAGHSWQPEPPWRQSARPPTPTASDVGAVPPAGFWRRAVALLVDLAVVWLLNGAGNLLTAALTRNELVGRAFGYTYMLIVPAAYFVLMHGTGGRTLGKIVAGARVVAVSGEAPGYGRALVRFLATCVSALPVFLGFLVVAVRRDKRALHDIMAGTRVIRVR